MKELILIRHGESEHHIKGLTGGWTDLPLTPRGKEQVERIGERIGDFITETCCVLWSSDLLRARETTAILSNHLKIQPSFSPALRELNNGDAKGLTLVETEKIQLPMTQPTIDWIPYPNAESWRMLNRRIVRFMRKLTQMESNQAVIVSHGNALVCIVHWWLGIRGKLISRISYDFSAGSMTRLGVNRFGEKVIHVLNDTGHLEFSAIR